MSEETKDKDQEVEKTPLTQEEADRIEKVFFEDGETIRLRDGNVYVIQPLVLKQARRLMQELGAVDMNLIVLNFLDEEKEKALFELLMLGFTGYPDMTVERLEEICDIRQAKAILGALVDLNGLKK